MKLNTILFTLAVAGVHCDDMDNTTDTTSADEECGFMCQMKEGWGALKTNVGCMTDTIAGYEGNQALIDAQAAWESSGTRTNVKGEGEDSFDWTYSEDLCKAWSEECNKVEGMTFTAAPAKTVECKYGAFGGDDVVTMATSNNGVCLADSDNCKAVDGDSEDIADSEMYTDIKDKYSISCESLISSGGAVTSTKFLGSLVAATTVAAFTVLN